MQCGELVYRKVPLISNTDNTTNNLTSNMLGNINNTMSISSNSIIKPPIKSEKETIHSGHFMVSHFEAEEQDDEDELAVPVPDAEQISGKLTIVGVTPAGINAQAFINANVHDRSNKNELSIETSLTKLFQCMSLAYRQKLTSPKWNRFKGIRLRWKDKIRLNNVIWRCWHMQFIMKQNTLVCQFASPLDVDTHNKPEAVVLEGKYWKRRLAAVTAEYKKWRLFHRNRILGCNKDGSDVLSEMDMLDWQPNSEEGNMMMVDEDYMDFMADTLFSTIQSNQPFAFPDSREIARAGLADFIQPSLGPLQPNLEDFMDTFEPLQELICSKLAPVPEEPSNEEMFRSNFVGLDLMPAESQQQQQNRISPMMLQQQSTSVVSTLPSSPQQQTVVQQQYIPPLKLELTEQQYNAEISQQINNLYEQATNLQQQQQNLQQEEANIQQQQQISIASQPTTTRCHQPRISRSIQRSNKLNQRQQSNAIQQQVLQQSNTVQNYQQMTTNYNQPYENLQQETSTYQNYQTIDMTTGNTTVNIRQQTTTNNNNNRPSRLQSEPFKMPQTSQSLMSGGGVLPSTTHQTNQHHVINQQPKQSLTNIRTNQQQQQQQQQVVKFQTSNNNFKVPTLPPVNQQQSWSPPPSQQVPQTMQQQQQQTPQAYSQPVQLIQVSDLNILQNNQQLKTTGAGNATLSPMSNVNKYTSIKQRGRVRSLSVGPRQPPPPLKSSASDPALLSNTNSVLLAHLLTNNTQTVYNFNSSTNTNEKSNLLQSGSVVTSNIKNNSSNIPILSVPSQPSTTTTLLISTPVQLPLEVQSPLSLPQNQIILNSIGSNTNLTTNSPKSVTNESPLSPLSPAESLGSPSMRNADRSPGPRDSRRVVHIHAEQKRRYNIKNGFDTLHSLIPQLSQNPNAKLSKAAMLQKGAEYIRQLKAERSQLKEEMDNLRQQIECLNTSISNCQSMLPATGAPVSRQRASKMREMFDEYVRNRTEENWKFWIFSFLFEPLLSSFNSSVSTSSLDDLYRSTLLWIEQHCSLVDLRPAVLNNLRVLSTKTDILSDPSKLPDEARQAAAATKNLRISSHHHHSQ